MDDVEAQTGPIATDVIFIGGRSGSGKTSVAAEASRILGSRSTSRGAARLLPCSTPPRARTGSRRTIAPCTTSPARYSAPPTGWRRA